MVRLAVAALANINVHANMAHFLLIANYPPLHSESGPRSR